MPIQRRNAKKARIRSFILIGDGYDELEVIYLIHKFRQAGLLIKIVGLFNKLVYSRQGVGIKADFILAEHPFDNLSEDCLLILPTGGRNGDVLRQDARVRSLLQLATERHGRIAVTDGRSNLASDVSQVFAHAPSVIRPEEDMLDAFVNTLTEQVVFAS